MQQKDSLDVSNVFKKLKNGSAISGCRANRTLQWIFQQVTGQHVIKVKASAKCWKGQSSG